MRGGSAHVVAHDLTEPMRTVSGLAQLLAGRLEGDGDALTSAIMAEADRLEAMVDDLLQVARAGGEAPREAVDLDVLVAEVLAMLGSAVAGSGADVRVAPLPVVPGVRAQLRQVVQNLLGNALKFRGDRPLVVRVAAEPLDGGAAWRITVADNGIGIAPADRARIFAPFARGDGADERPGSGIGLAVCAKVAAAHGGELTVEPAPGGGSVFALVLPA